MERYIMFLDWKNCYIELNYYENNNTTQDNLYSQYNPYQNTTGIFFRTGTNNFNICMGTP